MNRFARPLWIVTLVCFVPGCASYHAASLPSPVDGGGDPAPEITVSKHSTVRIHPTSGDAVSGEVLEITDAQIVVGRSGNYGYERTAFKRHEIERIEVLQAHLSAKAVAGTLAGLLILVTVVGVVAVHNLKGSLD